VLAPDLSSNCSLLRDLNYAHSNCKILFRNPALLFVVTTSPYWDWVICAPAAFLGSGSHISGSLSEIEPLFLVIRYNHGSPLCYHQVDRAEIWMEYRQHKGYAVRSCIVNQPFLSFPRLVVFYPTHAPLPQKLGFFIMY